MGITVTDTDVRIEDHEPAAVSPPAPARRALRLLPPLLMLAVVAGGVVLPLLTNRWFYYWDDSAAVAVPWYRRIAEDVLAGQFPLLQVDMWRGGNLAAEAATGFWNPLVLGASIATLPLANLAIVITVMKALFLAVMAGGVYLLSREYGAAPWPAAAVGAALPLGGYTLFVDGTSWVNGLLISAFTPWVWWAARRAVRGRGSFAWVVVAGYLCGSVGNPYGMLTAAVALGAVLVEGGVSGHLRRLPGLVAAGVAIVLTNVIVYLPFVLTSPVSYRSSSTETQVANDEFLAPSLTDLLGASSPSYQPLMTMWGGLSHWTVPVMYVSWFLLPLLPWVRFGNLRGRPMVALWIFAGAFLLLVLGPSQVWMFRWPLRLVSVLALALGVLWAVLASGDLHRTHRAARSAMSLAIVLFGGYVAWAGLPEQLGRHALATGAVLALVVLLVVAGTSHAGGFAVAAVGTLGVLALQVTWFPGNYNVANYSFPTSEPLLESRFDQRYEGITVQVADIHAVPPADLNPSGAYTDLLFGSLYSVAGVESLTDYSGIGFNDLDSTFCIAYQGSTCPAAWDRLWERPPGQAVPLADLLRAQTVVVQNALVDTRRAPAPEGWEKAEQNSRVTVWKRIDPLPWPQGRLAHTTSGVLVRSDISAGNTRETVTLDRPDRQRPATLTFARLAWPGYTATLDGQELPITTGPAGLLQVQLPPGTPDGQLELSFTPPGFDVGLVAMGAGLALTALLGVAGGASRFVRRRRGAATAHSNPTPGAPT